ncbi:MAG: hypothetical protein E7448_01670 [Ruminococcaceae bacterium]|nr:hypothetical protein [Oscillospiraceae bacterium]
MKQFLALFLCIFVLLSCAACSQSDPRDISCQDVIDTYENAGYKTWHKEEDDSDDGKVCYVQVLDNDSDEYIYFHFFDSEESAKEYADQRQWNVLLWLFSAIYSDPHWLATKTHGNIEYEYRSGTDLIDPFHELIDEGIFSIFR